MLLVEQETCTQRQKVKVEEIEIANGASLHIAGAHVVDGIYGPYLPTRHDLDRRRMTDIGKVAPDVDAIE